MKRLLLVVAAVALVTGATAALADHPASDCPSGTGYVHLGLSFTDNDGHSDCAGESSVTPGNNTWYLGQGTDGAFPQTSNDFVDGGAGPDRIIGGSGGDELHGGTQNDVIYGNQPYGLCCNDAGGWPDSLFGEGGDDVLVGGGGSDYFNGGGGNDILTHCHDGVSDSYDNIETHNHAGDC